ncbi:MAG: GNAT family N-acetyltransferase [Pirellulaceae bacterium]
MGKLTIRSAENSDVRPLARLHVDAWKVAYAPILKQKHLDWISVDREVRRKRSGIKDGTPFIVAEDISGLVGFMVYSRCTDEEAEAPGAIDIDSYWVHHQRTREGIGGALLRDMIRRTSPKRIYAWVLTGVKAGPAFYEKNGFRPLEETRQDFIFLGDPMPMVRYMKTVRKRPATARKKK